MIKKLRKAANLLLSGYSYLKSSLTGIPAIYGMPVYLGVELTNNCNLRCPECSSGSGIMTRKRGFMEPGLFDNLISELQPYLFNLNLYFQGESMLHPQFFSFLQSARSVRTTLSTNGHFLSVENAEKLVRSGLTKLIVSLDGMDQSTYAAYRKNGNIELVKEGIRNVSEAKNRFNSKIKIELQVLVNKLNESQIPDIYKFARKLNTSVKLKSMQITHKQRISFWLPKKPGYSRYKFINGEYRTKNKMPDRCLRMWLNPVITWDGKVVPCCFDKDAAHILGDLTQDSFREIWNSPKYRIFRKNVLSGRQTIEICRNCSSGLKGVKY
jgi:radical SAM protein with 4Fe4S-binding SPASM domain